MKEKAALVYPRPRQLTVDCGTIILTVKENVKWSGQGIHFVGIKYPIFIFIIQKIIAGCVRLLTYR